MSNKVQIWNISLQIPSSELNSVQSRYWSCLSQDEKDRANRFRFPKDKRRFVIARGTLRYLLSRQFDQSPEAVTFCYGTYGKPSVKESLAGTQCDFHFNLSHSEEMALCVLGHDRKVGIDIEHLRPIERLDSLMKRTLVPHEQQAVESEQAADQSRAFLQRWTCKEAYLKAIGLGLTRSMQTVEVQLSPPKLLRVPERCAAGWRLHLIALPKDYVGALTVAGEVKITHHQWQHDVIA